MDYVTGTVLIEVWLRVWSCCVINIDPSLFLSSKTVGGANLSIGWDTSDVEPVLEINSIVNSSKFTLFN